MPRSDRNFTVGAIATPPSSFTAAAPVLHLHTNTVKYRVRKAVERRGRPLEEDRLDVEIALLLCRRFPAILEPNWR